MQKSKRTPIPFTIEEVKRRDILAFYEQLCREPLRGLMPISRARAECFAHNPHGDPDDVVLVIARNAEQECVCYMAINHGLLRVGSKQLKIGWAGAGMLARRYYGNGITEAVVERSMSRNPYFAYDNVSAMMASTLRRLGVHEYAAPSTTHVDVAFLNPFSILERLLSKLQARTPQSLYGVVAAFHCLSGMLSRLVQPAIACLWRLILMPRVTLEYLDTFDAQLHPYFEQRDGVYFERNVATIDWMFRWPWFPREREYSTQEREYFFLDAAATVEHRVLVLRKPFSQRIRGAVVYSVRREGNRTTLKILDTSTGAYDLGGWWAALAIYLALKYWAHEVMIPRRAFDRFWRLPFTFRFIHSESAPYFFVFHDASFYDVVHQIEFKVSDGEHAFY